MLIRTKGTVNYDPRECCDILEIDIPDEEILALGKRYFKIASEQAGDVGGDTIAVIDEKQMPFKESRKKLFDDILEKYNIDEIAGNLGTLLDDNDCRYYGEHDNEWFWMWKFIEDIYNSAAKELDKS